MNNETIICICGWIGELKHTLTGERVDTVGKEAVISTIDKCPHCGKVLREYNQRRHVCR